MKAPFPVARCYRCLVPYPADELKPVMATCGCDHEYCDECLRDERLAGWLRYVGSRCALKSSSHAA